MSGNKTTLPLQYYLLSPTNPPHEFVDLHNKAFKSWMSITKRAFQEVENQNFDHLHDDFIRQHVLSCICYENEVVATFLHSFSSIYTDATRSFRYMNENFPEIFFQKIKNLGIKNVMTSHYMAIHPEWRKGTNNIQIAPIMVGLTLRVRDLFDADAFIGVWRRDRKVHELAYAQGGECIISNISSHNTPCDLILMNKATPYVYPSKEVEKYVNTLWDNRIDALFHTKGMPKRQTA